MWFPGLDDPRADLRELLHDADEGLLGFDCISVVKPFLGESYRRLAESLERAVALRYGLAPWTEADKKPHKRADRVAAASEAVHVVGWTRKEVRATLGIPHQPLRRRSAARRFMAGRLGSPGRQRSRRSAF